MGITLFIGLGNPGNKFLLTRHNVGFMILDRVAKSLGIDFIKSKKSLIALKDNMIFMKPQTFMNLSGDALRLFLQDNSVEKIVVIYDDLDLPLGSIRVREKGSTTHNGVLSIMGVVSDFIRVRIGIGKGANLKEYVLEKFKNSEKEPLLQVLKRAENCLVSIPNKSIESVMNEFNT